MVGAAYGDDQEAWWGPPQAGLCDEFADTGDGYGFLVETAQYAPGLIGSATPWISGADHKQRMADFRFGRHLHRAHPRPRPAAGSDVDANGEAVPTYAVTDELDAKNLRHGIEVQVRLHEAAGAHQIAPLAAGAPSWRRGDDLDAFIAAAPADPAARRRLPGSSAPTRWAAAGWGPTPTTSVAGPVRRAARHQGRLDRGRERLPDLLGHQPDDHDHGAGPAHREAIADDAGAAAPASQAEARNQLNTT